MHKTRVSSKPVIAEKKWTKQEKLRGPVFIKHTEKQNPGSKSPPKKRQFASDIDIHIEEPMPVDLSPDGSSSKRKRKGAVSHYFLLKKVSQQF